VTINLAKRVVPARLGPCQHAVEPFKAIEFAIQGLRRRLVNGQTGFDESSLDFLSTENSLVAHELHIMVPFYFQPNPSTSRVNPSAMQSGVSLLPRPRVT
jgi:hypothetical protein